jgi:hypothetical protein
MEISGKVVQICEPLGGESARGKWKKQEIIIETDEQYPKKVCLMNWNDKVDISNLKEGTRITAGINIESREFNSRWFTDIKIWKLDLADTDKENITNHSDNDIPPMDIPDENDPFGGNNTDEDDGLPF